MLLVLYFANDIMEVEEVVADRVSIHGDYAYIYAHDGACIEVNPSTNIFEIRGNIHHDKEKR